MDTLVEAVKAFKLDRDVTKNSAEHRCTFVRLSACVCRFTLFVGVVGVNVSGSLRVLKGKIPRRDGSSQSHELLFLKQPARP